MADNRSKRSELPKGAQSFRYPAHPSKHNPYGESMSYASDPGADEEDVTLFRLRHPGTEERIEGYIGERFREQKTGVVLDTVLMDDIAMLIDLGLRAIPERYPTPEKYLKDHDQFEALKKYLEHLAALGHTDAEIISNKIENFHGLTLKEAHVLRRYLIERKKYIE